MDTIKFNNFNIIVVILVILGAAGAVGIGYYGLKETSSTSQLSDQTGTSASLNSAQQTPSSTITEVVWPSNQELGVGSPSGSIPSMSFSPVVSQLSGPAGNQVVDAYLSAYQEAQRGKESYKEVSFNATIYQYLPLRDFLNALGIKINSEVYQTLDQTDYRAVFCYRDSNAIDRGLILSLQSGDVDHFIKLYPQLEAGLLSWQRTIFSDLKNIFFPDSDFDTTSPKFKTAYANPPDADQIEIATIKDESGADRFAGYNSSQQKIYLANSQECLKRILDAHPDDPE